MKTSQLNPTPSGTLGTVAKLIRLTETEDVEWSHWQYPTNNVKARRNLAEYLKMGCPKVLNSGKVVTEQLPDGYKLAHLILGSDFLSPEDVEKASDFGYTGEQLENFADTLPDLKTILWFRDNNYILVAGPSTEVFLTLARERGSLLFLSKSEEWACNQRFTPDDFVKSCAWLAIRKEPVLNSLSKTWNEQQDLLGEMENVPNASAVNYAVTTYFKVRGIYLLRGKYVRTSSVNTGGKHLIIGFFDKDGFNVTINWADKGYSDVSVLSARLLV